MIFVLYALFNFRKVVNFVWSIVDQDMHAQCVSLQKKRFFLIRYYSNEVAIF